MRLPLDFRSVFAALESEGVRYVTVGGLATVLHGVDRLTADIDLVIDLAPESAEAAIRVLTGLGFKPRVPVDPMQFADPEARRSWIEDKGMRVFNLWDPEGQRPGVDLFVEYPLAFEDLWAQSSKFDLGDTQCRIVSLRHLVEIKRAAGRKKDLEDAARLEELLQDE